VLTTFKAKGLVLDTHPLGAGVLGRSGTPVASWLMNESDLHQRPRRDRTLQRRHRRRARCALTLAALIDTL
jgi:hypothetical protein